MQMVVSRRLGMAWGSKVEQGACLSSSFDIQLTAAGRPALSHRGPPAQITLILSFYKRFNTQTSDLRIYYSQV